MSHGKCTVMQNNGYLCHQDAVFVVETHQACAQRIARALTAALTLDSGMEPERYAVVYRNRVQGVGVTLHTRRWAQTDAPPRDVE